MNNFSRNWAMVGRAYVPRLFSGESEAATHDV